MRSRPVYLSATAGPPGKVLTIATCLAGAKTAPASWPEPAWLARLAELNQQTRWPRPAAEARPPVRPYR
ncbi:MAG: hypothetical protein WA806_01790, partial [Bradyrhizobium sp.]